MKRSSAGAQDASFSSLLASHKNAKRRRKRRKVAAQNGEVINDGPKVIAMNKPSAEELAEAAKAAEAKYGPQSAKPPTVPGTAVKNVCRQVGSMYPTATPSGQRPWLSDDWLKSLDPPSCGMGNKFFLYSMYRLYAKFNRKRLFFFSKDWLRDKFCLAREVRYDVQGNAESDESGIDSSQITRNSRMLQSVFDNCSMYLQWSPAVLVHSRLVYAWFATFIAECIKVSRAKYPEVSFDDHLVVHLRTGDIFDERVRQSQNKSNSGFIFYTQPPAWFYGWLARKNAYKTVSIVTQTPESTYCKAVKVALETVSSITSVHLRTGKMLEDFGLLMQAKHFVSSVSTFSWWAIFLGNKHFADHQRGGLKAKGEDSAAAARRQVFVPLTGYWHPQSKHGSQCKFVMDEASNQGCCDRYEYILEKEDYWQNTNGQRSKLFEFNAPNWFLEKYGT